LLRVLIQEQMVVAKMNPAHVPVEILRFHVQGKHIGKQVTQASRYFSNTVAIEISCWLGNALFRDLRSSRIILSHRFFFLSNDIFARIVHRIRR